MRSVNSKAQARPQLISGYLERTMSIDNSRQIVIAGATGLIGTELVRRLSERGDRVIVLARDPDRARRSLPQAFEHLKWSSGMSGGEWVTRIDGAYGVINLAGAPIAVRWSDEVKRKIYDSRIEGTRNIVGAIDRATQRPKVLVNASAVGYYGALREEPVAESASRGEDFLAKLCADWETEALAAERFGVRTVMVRTGIVLDPKEGALAKLLLPFRLFVGGPIGNGRQPFPWIHIADEVGIFLWALDMPDLHGPINAVAPGIVSNREFSRTLGHVLHRPSLLPVPRPALGLVFGEGSIVLTGGQQAVPERATRLGYRFKFPDLTKALADLLNS
jgi:uncharacterized protein (TIGR01777 family)